MTESLEKSLDALHISSNVEHLPGLSDARTGVDDIVARIDNLTRRVAQLLESLYEIQEIRHGSNHSDRLQPLLNDLESSVSTLPDELDSMRRVMDLQSDATLASRLDNLDDDIKELAKQYAALEKEIKEDSWLSRFNSTADQANAMIEPIEASLMACMRYIETVSNSPVPVPFVSDLPELPSISHLQDLVKRHESMRTVYTPSINKILRMMEKSISDRETKNGAMLRRFDEMSRRWTELQSRLRQLDARVRIVQSEPGLLSPGDRDTAISSSPKAPYHGYSTPSRSTISHRSSVSSGASQSVSHSSLGLGQASLAPQPTLHRKSSFMSATSASTAKTVERNTPTAKTPVNKRISSVTRPGIPSPTPSSSSLVSRLPVSSSPVPRLSLSNMDARGSEMEVLTTPSRPRLSGAHTSMTAPRSSLAPSLSRMSTTPRHRGPPSSFRSFTPTTSGRPSSRMSMGSYAPSGVAPANLQPFRPSQYDLLDTHVKRIIDEVGFDLFVARVDQPLKRGQRKGDNEEWKGEYVFGAGQRTTSVKLLTLAGKGTSGGPRVKCLARVQGAWQDLQAVLEQRKGDQ